MQIQSPETEIVQCHGEAIRENEDMPLRREVCQDLLKQLHKSVLFSGGCIQKVVSFKFGKVFKSVLTRHFSALEVSPT